MDRPDPLPPAPPPPPAASSMTPGQTAALVVCWLLLVPCLLVGSGFGLISPMASDACGPSDPALLCRASGQWLLLVTGVGAAGLVGIGSLVMTLLLSGWSRAMVPWVGLLVGGLAAALWGGLFAAIQP